MSQQDNSQSIKQFAQRCVEHLDEEIKLMESHARLAGAIFDSFGKHDEEFEGRLEGYLGEIKKISDELQTRRLAVRTEMAQWLNVSEAEATVAALLNRLPESVDEKLRLTSQRKRLLELETIIQQQNRTNSLLIRQSMDLYQKIAGDLAGLSGQTATYSPRGEMNENSGASFIRTEC